MATSGFTAYTVEAEGPDGPVSVPCLTREEAARVASSLWSDDSYFGIVVREVIAR